MKTICLVGSAALLSSVLACSGRYDVGGEGDSASGGSAAGAGAAPGSGGFAGTAPSNGGAAGSAPGGGQGNAPTVTCEPESGPPPVVGDFVAPALVWERVTRLVEGAGAPPPSNLPDETTYAWAGQIVTQAFQRARLQRNAAGASAWVNHWLFRTEAPPEPALSVDWGAALIESEPALERLLLDMVGPDRRGVFSEPAWLIRFPSISARGAGISARVLGREVPASPQGIPSSEPSELLTRRQELRVAVDASPACQACHFLMDDLGYPYGHFDEAGDYQAMDDGLPIDTSGRYGVVVSSAGPDPVLFEFADAQELGEQLAESCEARTGIAQAFARAALGLEGLSLSEQDQLVSLQAERLTQAFLFSEAHTYEDLVRAYAQSPLVLQR